MSDEYLESVKHCRHCGGILTQIAAEPIRLKCYTCGRTTFLNPKVGVGLLIEREGSLLLARRADEPFKDWWVLPSGYVEYEESCEEAAIREASEELSVRVSLLGVYGVYSYGDDPRSRMVFIVYRASFNGNTARAADDVAECAFFDLDDLPSNIAFEGNRRAIADFRAGRSH